MTAIIYQLIEEKDQFFVELGIGEKRGVAPSALTSWAKAKDQHLLKLFQNQEKKSGGSPYRFALRTLQGSEAETMRLLAQTSNLFFQGKKIVLDPFTTLHYFFEAQESGEKISIKALLRGAQQSLPVNRFHALFAGTPPCALCGHLLQNIAQEIHSRWLFLAFPEPFLSTREEFTSLFREIREDKEEAPEVIFLQNFQIEERELKEETRPILKLRDRSGAFADLWIEYSRSGEIGIHDPSRQGWRLHEEEKSWERDLLESSFQAKVVDSSHYYCPMDKVSSSLTFLLEIGWKIFDYRGREVVRQGDASLQVENGERALLLKGHIHYGEHRADVKDVVGSFNRRERFIELSPDRVGLFEGEKIPFMEMAQEIEMGEEGVCLPKHKIGMGIGSFQHPSLCISEEIGVLLRRLVTSDLVSHPCALTSTFQGRLHPYQQEGLNWMHMLYENRLGGLLADEMGLGKTVQVLALLSLIGSLKEPILIVAPTSLLFHWRKECEKFAPSLSLYMHEGADRSTTVEELGSQQIILTSYAILRIDRDLLTPIHYSAVILDEAQMIKNPSSQIAEVICQFQAPFRLAITGTPLENRHQDLWSIFQFLLPGLLGELSAFQAKMTASQADQRYLHRMRQLIRPFILRRRKELVRDQLPEKVEQVIWVEMDENQRQFYEEKLRAYKQGFIKKVREDGVTLGRMEVLEAILRLRQICCHPQLADPSLPFNVEGSAKLQKLLEDLEAIVAEGRKALIYSQFTSMLHLIESEVKKRGWGYVLLEGATKNREQVVEKFQEDPETPLFLLSLKAGGVGLNLTAADYVLLYDPWWNEAVERQAIDRAHRLGRREQVIARRYVVALSIEEKIMKMKAHKSALVEQLFEGEILSTELNIEQLLELLDDYTNYQK